MEAAEALKSPIIIMIGPMEVDFAGKDEVEMLDNTLPRRKRGLWEYYSICGCGERIWPVLLSLVKNTK